MVQTNIYLSDEEDKKIERFAYMWEISKQDAIKRIIREFKEVINEPA